MENGLFEFFGTRFDSLEDSQPKKYHAFGDSWERQCLVAPWTVDTKNVEGESFEHRGSKRSMYDPVEIRLASSKFNIDETRFIKRYCNYK